MKIERSFNESCNITLDSLLSMLVKSNLDKKIQEYYKELINDSYNNNTKGEILC